MSFKESVFLISPPEKLVQSIVERSIKITKKIFRGEAVMNEVVRNFILNWNHVATSIHDWAIRKGFWEDERNDGEMIALMHSELSEALEAIRTGNKPDDKIPEFNGLEAELADCVIRIMDMAAGRKLRIAEAIVAKMQYFEMAQFDHKDLEIERLRSELKGARIAIAAIMEKLQLSEIKIDRKELLLLTDNDLTMIYEERFGGIILKLKQRQRRGPYR